MVISDMWQQQVSRYTSIGQGIRELWSSFDTILHRMHEKCIITVYLIPTPSTQLKPC